MARPRKTNADNWMPPGVRFNGYYYILRSKLTDGREVRLCGKTASRSQVWACYETHKAPPTDTLEALCNDYMASPKFKALAGGTQKKYNQNLKSLGSITFNGGQRFLDISPGRIDSVTLQQIVDLRLSQGDPVKGNREIKGFLSAVYSWALTRRHIPGMTTNPCHAVERNPEKPREHYIADHELQLAQKHASREMRLYMELAYLTYGRAGEILDLSRRHITDEGALIERIKRGKTNIVGWSDRLHAVVDECKSIKVISPYLLTRENGRRYTYSMLAKDWAACMEKCKKENPEFRPFTRHDVKKKGESDVGIYQNSAGRKTPSIAERYKIKPQIVKPAK